MFCEVKFVKVDRFGNNVFSCSSESPDYERLRVLVDKMKEWSASNDSKWIPGYYNEKCAIITVSHGLKAVKLDEGSVYRLELALMSRNEKLFLFANSCRLTVDYRSQYQEVKI